MKAFVLSGGGSRGALQAGAILALLDRGIVPDLIVGTSVGAINGVALAAAANQEGARCMAERWPFVTCEDIFPGNPAQVAWRLLRQQPSLYPNTALRRFIISILPPNVRRFKDLQIPLLVTATDLATGRLHLFGADPNDRLVDAIMASAAIPPYLPPYRYDDTYYIDGGIVANLPLSVALERGATEIYALEIGHDQPSAVAAPSLRQTVSRSIQSMLTLQARRERELAKLARREGVTIHDIELLHYSGLPHENFNHGAELLELGRSTTASYLENGQLPSTIAAPVRLPPYRELTRRLRASSSLAKSQRIMAQSQRLMSHPAWSRVRRTFTRG
jgi:NTE family protein